MQYQNVFDVLKSVLSLISFISLIYILYFSVCGFAEPLQNCMLTKIKIPEKTTENGEEREGWRKRKIYKEKVGEQDRQLGRIDT